MTYNMQLKICFRCKEGKQPTEFYKDRSRNDGLSGECKGCHYARQMKSLSQKTRRRKYARDYYLDPQNSLKIAARIYLNNRITLGHITRPEKCSSCEQVKRVEAHHHDYSKPLDVTWLCAKCHRAVHKTKEAMIGARF